MSHRIGPAKPILSRRMTALIATVVVTVLLIAVAIYNLPSGSSASVSGSGVQRYTVGERDEVEITPPARSWVNICTDKSVYVSVDGNNFRLEPPCKIFVQDKSGNLVPAETMGDNTSGIYHIKATPGQKLAQVTVSSGRK